MARSIRSEPPPPAPTRPDPRGARRGRLSRRQRRLIEEACGAEEVFACVRTASRTDVGWWFRRGRVILCLLADHLVLLAAGKRPYVQRIALRDLRESQYNHVTGALVLSPAEGVRVRRLTMPPREAYRVLVRVQEDRDHV